MKDRGILRSRGQIEQSKCFPFIIQINYSMELGKVLYEVIVLNDEFFISDAFLFNIWRMAIVRKLTATIRRDVTSSAVVYRFSLSSDILRKHHWPTNELDILLGWSYTLKLLKEAVSPWYMRVSSTKMHSVVS